MLQVSVRKQIRTCCFNVFFLSSTVLVMLGVNGTRAQGLFTVCEWNLQNLSLNSYVIKSGFACRVSQKSPNVES